MEKPSTAVALSGNNAIAAFNMDEKELIDTLRNSFFPGAADASIKMVIGWCKATGKDPMKRPVHIVPMSVKKVGSKNEYEFRDVVMPGIGDYRTDAARTGQYAGIGEAKFGEDREMKVGNTVYVYPEWCEIEVYRMVGGVRCAFSSGKVYYMETYATSSRDSKAPNAMWSKRPRGQLEKCAEAMALRRAFPEAGSNPTKEEMEGKVIGAEDGEFEAAAATTIKAPQATAGNSDVVDGVIVGEESPAATSPPPPVSPPPPPTAAAAASPPPPPTGGAAPKLASDGALSMVRSHMTAAKIAEADLCKKLGHTGEKLDGITFTQVNDAMKLIKGWQQ